ncbi:MAG: MATE family efflux transporter [Eubacteriaceae bacterium]
MDDKRITLLKEAPVTRAIFKLSIPVVMGMMVQVLYNLVDTFFIGQLGDPNQLAAAAITTPVFMMMMAIAGIVSTGAASYISRCLGADKKKEANRTLSIGLGICILLGMLVMAFGFAFISPLIKGLGASQETFGFTYEYIFVLLLGTLAIMGNYSIGQLLRAEGSVMPSMIGMMIGTLANIILDPIFIFGMGMGIKGAAIATVLGNVFALIYYLICYSKGKTLLQINVKDFGFDKKIWKEIFVIGIPATLSQVLMSVAMVVCNNIAGTYSDIVLAGMGVASKVMTIGTFVFMGFAAGCQPLVGYNYGAKNFHRVKEIIKKAIIITSLIGIGLTVTFGIFAQGIMTIFTSSQEVIEAGAIILRALMWSLPFVGGQMLCATTVQSMGKALPALIISIARQGILYIPFLLLFDQIFGFNGFIYAQPITDALMIVISGGILLSIIHKEMKEGTKSNTTNPLSVEN